MRAEAQTAWDSAELIVDALDIESTYRRDYVIKTIAIMNLQGQILSLENLRNNGMRGGYSTLSLYREAFYNLQVKKLRDAVAEFENL